MHRSIAVSLIFTALFATTRPADAADNNIVDPPSADSGTSVSGSDSGFVVEASTWTSLSVVDAPGPANGPRIRCGYFQVVSIDTPIDVARTPIDSPIPGFPYTLSCWYQPPGEAAGDTVGGYPRIVFFEPSTPAGPDLVSTAQVTAFAREHMRFDPPVPALAPADRQIVGIQTWLAVTSQLDYTPVTAQAGLVWATVRASFRDVTWILGDGSELVCTADATTLWDPDLPGDAQHSDCTHVYTDASGEAPYEASVTVNWQVDVRDNTNPATWRPYETFELTTALAIPVDEIQAVIR